MPDLKLRPRLPQLALVLRGRRRGTAMAMAGLVAGSAVAVILAQDGYRTDRMHMSSGMAWVASIAVAELSLLDGSAADAADGVRLRSAETGMTTAQLGGTGYALTSRLRRVDGATHQVSDVPAGKGWGPSLYATPGDLFIVDPQIGRIDSVDPTTLASRLDNVVLGRRTQFAATPSRLWAWQPEPRSLSWFDDRKQRSFPVPSGLRSRLTTTQEYPVVVDPDAAVARLLDPHTGDVVEAIPVNTDEQTLVGGAVDEPRLLVVDPRRATLAVCDFDHPSCAAPMALGAPSTFGTPFGWHGMAVVPDLDNAGVWLADVKKGTAPVFVRLFGGIEPQSFDVFVRDGITFFNDPGSDRAGVIREDGNVINIVKYVTKVVPSPTAPRTVKKPAPTPTLARKPDQHSTAGPAGSEVDPSRGPARNPRGTPIPTSARGTPFPGRLRILDIQTSPSLPLVGEDTQFSAVLVGGVPKEWSWRLSRLPGPESLISATVAKFSFRFTSIGDYRITLRVSNGTESDEFYEDFVVARPTPPLQCGDHIEESVRFTHDLVCTGSTSGAVALQVDAPGVVVDLAGFRLVSGEGGIHLMGIAFAESDVTIRNGTVTGFVYGIRAAGENILLENLQVDYDEYGGLEDDAAIRLSAQGAVIRGGSSALIRSFGGSDIQLIDTETRFLAWPTDGYRVEPDNYNRMSGARNLTITGSTVHFISLVECTNVVLSGNLLSGWIFNKTDGLRIFDNDIEGGMLNSVESAYRGGTRVENNRFVGGTYGLRIGRRGPTYAADGTDIAVTGNTFTDIGASALTVFNFTGTTARVRVSGNEFVDTGYRRNGQVDSQERPMNDAIHVEGPGAGLTVSNNVTRNSYGYGIFAPDGGLTVTDHTSDHDGQGCEPANICTYVP